MRARDCDQCCCFVARFSVKKKKVKKRDRKIEKKKTEKEKDDGEIRSRRMAAPKRRLDELTDSDENGAPCKFNRLLKHDQVWLWLIIRTEYGI